MYCVPAYNTNFLIVSEFQFVPLRSTIDEAEGDEVKEPLSFPQR